MNALNLPPLIDIFITENRNRLVKMYMLVVVVVFFNNPYIIRLSDED